jgi:hypothetical protein
MGWRRKWTGRRRDSQKEQGMLHDMSSATHRIPIRSGLRGVECPGKDFQNIGGILAYS